MMIGIVHAAIPNRPDLKQIADYFSISQDRLIDSLSWMECQANPELLLLQNKNPEADVRAAVFMATTSSVSYRKSGSPRHTRIWRDFYYQCLFSGMQYLEEVGCTSLRIENPGKPYMWSWDGLSCLLEAVDNIQRYVNPSIEFSLEKNSFIYDLHILKKMHAYDKHRLIGICPHVRHGLNMRTVFIEGKNRGLQMTGVSANFYIPEYGYA